jgi:DeoR/GlpR family transcriptional regulator of sugar metabolism
MFGIERLQKIREIIREKKSIDVPTLSKELSVSDVTIRRDLDKLEKEGFIIKTYGGAILKENLEIDTGTANQGKNPEEEEQISEKKKLGKIAASMVEDNDVIYLGNGTTCLEIARNLKNKKRVIIVTNDIFIAAELHDKGNIKVILTGGELIPYSGMLVGNFALKTLKDVLIEKAFISVQGIDLSVGYTVNTEDEVSIYKDLRNISKEVIVVADYKKFGKIGLTKLDDLANIKTVITNKKIPDDYKRFYFDHYIKLYTTYELA